MGTLEGKVAIVTGAAGGIGGATAALFLREGASVMVVDRVEAEVRRTAESFRSTNAAHFAADVSDPAQAKGYVEATLSRFGAVEFLGIQAVAPHMATRGGGSIVITSSIAGLIGYPGLSAYVASKHAAIGLMKTAACELAALGIRVNTVNPGPIENRMMRSIEEQAMPGHGSDVKKGFVGMVPMGRYGTNEEIANLALFLASSASSYCTGGVFLADGGFVAH